MKNHPLPEKKQSLALHRFWVVLACIGLVAVWYCFMALFVLGSSNYGDALNNVGIGVQSWILIMYGPIVASVATILTIPFALILFKKLKVFRPRLSAIAFPFSLLFAFCLFGFALDVAPFIWRYKYEWFVVGSLVAVLVVSLVLYWFITRKLSRKLSREWVVAIIVGLPVLIVLLDIAQRVSVGFF